MRRARPDLWPAAATLLIAAFLCGEALFRFLPDALQTFAYGVAAAGAAVLLSAAWIRVSDRMHARAVAQQFTPPEVSLGDVSIAAGNPPPHLFDLPWYVVLGRAQCGKSSLIRALAGDATPTRLAPRGVDCWATPDAVFIELNTPDASLSSDEPAIELLALLRRHRPHRPISGLILALPADRILKASAEHAALASAAIAARLQQIRDAVATRFPVYVALTRADRLLGFRELTVLAANQSHTPPWLGWINPGPSDTTPTPDLFDSALSALRTEAIHRRTSLLTPPAGEPVATRSFDRLDAAFALPDSIARLTKPLVTLLSGLIAPDQPHLFFRGIFLTAAYPAGPVIDPETPSAAKPAAIRHDTAVPLAPLGPLFAAHILPERNLVTPARNAAAAHRHRRDLIASVTAAAAVLPTIIAVGGSLLIREGPRSQLPLWRSMAALAASPAVPTDHASALVAADLSRRALAAADESLLLLPAPSGSPSHDLRTLRPAAAHTFFQSTALGPILDATASKLTHLPAPDWTPAATAALAQLAHLARLADSTTPPAPGPGLDITIILTFLSSEPTSAVSLQRQCDTLLSSPRGRAAAASLATPQVRAALIPALATCIEYHEDLASGRAGALRDLLLLRDAAREFEAAAAEIARPDTDSAITNWRTLFDRLNRATTNLDAVIIPLSGDLARAPSAICSTAAQNVATSVNAAAASLRDAFASNPAALADIDSALERIQATILKTTNDLNAELPPLISSLLIPDSAKSDRPYRVRFRVFAAADALLSTPPPSPQNTFGRLGEAISSNLSGADAALGSIKSLVNSSPLIYSDASAAAALVESRRRVIAAATLRAAATAVILPVEDFNHLADDLAERRTDLAPSPIPDLPLCPAAGRPIEARFNPAIAALIFADWAAISRLARGQDVANLPADELAGLLDNFDAARATYTRFASEYLRYWSSLPDTAAAPELPSWPELPARLRSFKPAQANAAYRTLLNAILAAFSAIPPDLAQERPLLDARTRISAEIAELDKTWFDDACRRARDKWSALSPDPEAARTSILQLSRDRFQKDFLEIYGEGSRGVRYWNRTILSSLSALAAADTSRRDLAESLIRETRVFPLCADADPATALTPVELALTRRRAAAIIKTGLGAMTEERGRTLADGIRTEFELLNDRLALLAGDVLSSDDRQDAWAHKIRAVLGFLDPEAPQFCEIFILDAADIEPPVPGALPAADEFPFFQVTIGNAPPLAPLSTTCPADRGITFALPGPGLTLRLVPSNPASPAAAFRLSSPWNVISLLRHAAAIVDDTADSSGRLARVPLVFADASGRVRYLWLGIRFQRQPPALADWPEQADWPD